MHFAGAVGCGSDDSSPDPPPPPDAPKPKALPPLTSAPLSTEETLSLGHAVADGTLDPRVPDDVTKMLGQGFGDTKAAAGLAVVDRTLDGMPAPLAGANRKLLVRFVHLADTQLADDESPVRLANFDSPQGATSGAYRPQEGHECRILNAAVRTINFVHESTPVDFVLLGGDNADNAQTNEVDWFRAILGGAAAVSCDSGADNDPTPGPDNDPKDPFVAEGLAMPWRWVTGNHDVLNQGNFPVAAKMTDAVGTLAANGTRDWSQPGGPVSTGDFPADAQRKPLTRDELVSRVAGDGDGHGLDAATAVPGKAYYTFDVEGTPLRFIVLDTAAETGASDGVVHQADVDAFVKPALDEAAQAGKLVVLTSHHASNLLTDGSGAFGEKQPDAVMPDAWRALVGGYDNVLMHLAGHTHVHRVTVAAPATGTPYFELETSALADWPHQMRFIEIWDEDDGWISIRAIGLDYSVEGDPVAAEGRSLGVLDVTSGWGVDGSGDPEQRNVALWVQKP